MATRVYQTPAGTDLPEISHHTGLIAGVRIDNPTGSYLRVTATSGIDDYVPPYTLAWARPLVPAALKLSVLFGNSPSGAVSDPSGAAVTVTLFNEPQLASNGMPSGSQASLPQAAELYKKAYSATINVTQSLASTTLIAAGAVANIIIPLRLEARAIIVNDETIRGLVRISWFYDPPTIAETGITSFVLSPERPSYEYDMLPGTFEFPGESEVLVKTIAQRGMGATTEIDVAMFYYELAAGS